MVPAPKIFVNNLTVLDCAILVSGKQPQGFSFQISVVFHGSQDADGILFDFSLAKRSFKDLIDKYFDHKLLVSSECVHKKSENLIWIRSTHPEASPFSSKPIFALKCPKESVEIIPRDVLEPLFQYNTSSFEAWISKKLLANMPKQISMLDVQLRAHENRESPFFFNYLHSLKFHFGNCQRFHGHSNTIEIHENLSFNSELSSRAAVLLDGKYLIEDSYIKKEGLLKLLTEFDLSDSQARLAEADHCLVSYEGNQGPVELCFVTTKVISLKSESTIENISTYVFEKMQLNPTQHQVYAFEGLQKGAVYP